MGLADDRPDVPADGVGVLTFDEAQLAARTWAKRRLVEEQADAGAEAAGPTVGQAVEAYVAMRKGREPKAGRDAELRLTRHVLTAPLSQVPLRDLTERHLSGWRDGVRRGGRGAATRPWRPPPWPGC